ncbi:cation transporter [Thermosphaera chiliense]|uniref:Cation transporter n=1 Tax=Thermosphaera chiliense TaxID=3402707 RepID=A0A7M1UP31_9CREN|nr:cation transporter [Thermosphaera aggregans]QOR93971.1 cation transporter [Thermosphaera aggregans]
MNRDVVLIVLGSIAGGLLKIIGGLFFGSNTLFVDALTSFANLLALFVVLYFKRATMMPADSDHHFGHERFEYVGVLVTMLAYSFAAGVSVARLSSLRDYSVGIEAFYLAVASIIAYLPPVLLSRKMSSSLRVYGEFTASEFIESSVGIVATIGGALYSYLIDFSGALLLTGFIFYELLNNGKGLVEIMVDTAPPLNIYEEVVKEAEDLGLKIEAIRLRRLSHTKFHGDILVKGGKDMVEKVSKLKKTLKTQYGVDVCVEMKE